MPSRTDWLLRFIVGVSPHYDGSVDRIRVMKGMFLFQEEGHAPRWEVNYAFRPYDYGPFTADIYRDTEILLQGGLIVESGSQSYRATEVGRKYVAGLGFDDKALSSLIELRVELSDLSFRDLLRRVYRSYPQSASRSIARDVLE